MGNPPATAGFSSQRTRNSENVSILWRHHAVNFADISANESEACVRNVFSTWSSLPKASIRWNRDIHYDKKILNKVWIELNANVYRSPPKDRFVDSMERKGNRFEQLMSLTAPGPASEESMTKPSLCPASLFREKTHHVSPISDISNPIVIFFCSYHISNNYFYSPHSLSYVKIAILFRVIRSVSYSPKYLKRPVMTKSLHALMGSFVYRLIISTNVLCFSTIYIYRV